MIEYKVVNVAWGFENLSQHFQQHYEEVGMYTEIYPLDIDRHHYEALEQAGLLTVIAAMDGLKPIGYMVWIVKRHPRYPVIVGFADFYWLHPDYRGKTVAYRMFKFAEKELANRGVERLIVNYKISHPQGRFLMGLGFESFEVSCTKLLKANI